MSTDINLYRAVTRMDVAKTEGRFLNVNPENDRYTLRLPVNPPGSWTRFKAWLADNGVTFDWTTKAQAKRDDRIALSANVEVRNTQMRAGFMTALRKEYGQEIADMASASLGGSGTAPLTRHQVEVALKLADTHKAATTAANRRALEIFIDSPRQMKPGAKADLESAFEAAGHGTIAGLGRPGDDPHNVRDARYRFVTDALRMLPERLPGFHTETLDASQLANMARDALSLFALLNQTIPHQDLYGLLSQQHRGAPIGSSMSEARLQVHEQLGHEDVAHGSMAGMIREQALAVYCADLKENLRGELQAAKTALGHMPKTAPPSDAKFGLTEEEAFATEVANFDAAMNAFESTPGIDDPETALDHLDTLLDAHALMRVAADHLVNAEQDSDLLWGDQSTGLNQFNPIRA